MKIEEYMGALQLSISNEEQIDFEAVVQEQEDGHHKILMNMEWAMNLARELNAFFAIKNKQYNERMTADAREVDSRADSDSPEIA